MPYKTISAAEDDGFPITAEGVPLTLAQINKLADIYDAVKEQGTADNPMAVAWTQWKQIYKKVGDKWVKRNMENMENMENRESSTVKLNSKGKSYATSLINAGKVDKTSSWSFDAADGNKILGEENWPNYARHHLAIDTAEEEETKARYKYPFAKNNKVYRSALIAIRQRAGQQHLTSVFNAAGDLLEMIDGKKEEKSQESKERRFLNTEFRIINRDGKRKITGYAAKFNKFSENLGGFVERIRPGAFKDSLGRSDVRALFNHDPNYVLGRSTSGTLKLKEDETGLYMEIDPPDTQFARDLMVSIERGDISQQSFGFTIDKESWEGLNQKDSEPIRNLENIGQLFDVSLVTYPAYPDTTVALRSMAQAQEINTEIPQSQKTNEIDFEILQSDFNALSNGKSIPEERRNKYIRLLDEHKPSKVEKDKQIVKDQDLTTERQKSLTWEQILNRLR